MERGLFLFLVLEDHKHAQARHPCATKG